MRLETIVMMAKHAGYHKTAIQCIKSGFELEWIEENENEQETRYFFTCGTRNLEITLDHGFFKSEINMLRVSRVKKEAGKLLEREEIFKAPFEEEIATELIEKLYNPK